MKNKCLFVWSYSFFDFKRAQFRMKVEYINFSCFIYDNFIVSMLNWSRNNFEPVFKQKYVFRRFIINIRLTKHDYILWNLSNARACSFRLNNKKNYTEQSWIFKWFLVKYLDKFKIQFKPARADNKITD